MKAGLARGFTPPQVTLVGRDASLVPMHYGTFKLGREPMEEPVPRLLAAAKQTGVSERMIVLAEGETLVV